MNKEERLKKIADDIKLIDDEIEIALAEKKLEEKRKELEDIKNPKVLPIYTPRPPWQTDGLIPSAPNSIPRNPLEGSPVFPIPGNPTYCEKTL